MDFEGHLHVHTEYSMLDGMTPIEELILRAKELGQIGIAITDHGGSSGLYEAWKLGKKHDFNVLLGEEFYFENPISELKTGHLILIAKDYTGLQNIFKLQQLAYDNVYYKPRINFDMLKKHSEGLICTTACIANAIGQLILKGEKVLAMNHLLQLKEIFGDDLYVELQSTTNREVETVNRELSKWVKDMNLKCILTTDVHYLLKEDYEVHETLLCIQQKAKMSSEKRWKFEHNDYWLKSEEELIDDASSIEPDVIDLCFNHIHEIFQKCKGVDFVIEDHLPEFCETREDEDILLYNETMDGYKRKVMARGEGNQAFMNDLFKELDVIATEGYSGYFLVVQEYIKWARENGIPVGDGRGSGAGSKVAYTIGITEVNPDKYDLLFERFMAKGRQPDSYRVEPYRNIRC